MHINKSKATTMVETPFFILLKIYVYVYTYTGKMWKTKEERPKCITTSLVWLYPPKRLLLAAVRGDGPKERKKVHSSAYIYLVAIFALKFPVTNDRVPLYVCARWTPRPFLYPAAIQLPSHAISLKMALSAVSAQQKKEKERSPKMFTSHWRDRRSNTFPS